MCSSKECEAVRKNSLERRLAPRVCSECFTRAFDFVFFVECLSLGVCRSLSDGRSSVFVTVDVLVCACDPLFGSHHVFICLNSTYFCRGVDWMEREGDLKASSKCRTRMRVKFSHVQHSVSLGQTAVYRRVVRWAWRPTSSKYSSRHISRGHGPR